MVRGIRDRRAAVLLVERDMHAVTGSATRWWGSNSGAGSRTEPAEIRRSERVIEAYLGRAVATGGGRSVEGKHALKGVRNRAGSVFRQAAQAPDEPRLVHRTYLIQGDLPLLVLECDIYPRGIVAPGRRHRRDDRGPDVPIPVAVEIGVPE